jgi:hypothetical protein
MKKTMISEPLNASHKGQLNVHRANFVLIQNELQILYINEMDITYEDFLLKLGLDEEGYMLAIRSSLKSSRVFLKRNSSEININAYNTDILYLHRANMDIQFILDPYACVIVARMANNI